MLKPLEKPNLRAARWRATLWIAIMLILLSLARCPQVANAQDHPKEPPLSELHKWYPVQDGTVVLEYRMVDKYGVKMWRYKHAQKAVAGKVPACNEVTVVDDEIRLLTQEVKPSLYLIEKKNNGFSPDFNLDFTFEKY